jgi:hypothetical protein
VGKSSRSLLKQFIREAVRGTSRRFITLEGNDVEYGSQSHIDTYDSLLEGLTLIRRQLLRSDRKERDRVTRCMESLRFLRRKAHREGLSSGLIKEKEREDR